MKKQRRQNKKSPSWPKPGRGRLLRSALVCGAIVVVAAWWFWIRGEHASEKNPVAKTVATPTFNQREQNQWLAARTEFETALMLNPDNYKAHGNLALNDAEQHARAALKIFPGDTLSRETLDAILGARGATGSGPIK